MKLKLQVGMKEDDTINSAGSIEERNTIRKHREIGDIPISDDPEKKRERLVSPREDQK